MMAPNPGWKVGKFEGSKVGNFRTFEPSNFPTQPSLFIRRPHIRTEEADGTAQTPVTSLVVFGHIIGPVANRGVRRQRKFRFGSWPSANSGSRPARHQPSAPERYPRPIAQSLRPERVGTHDHAHSSSLHAHQYAHAQPHA